MVASTNFNIALCVLELCLWQTGGGFNKEVSFYLDGEDKGGKGLGILTSS